MKNRWQVAALAACAVVVIAGKQYYRTATPDELRWLLAPTAHAVSALGFGHFAFDAQAGWVDANQGFAIAPACAGLHFALAAFLALVIGWLGRVRDLKSLVRTLGAAAAIAYVATLVINTIRISIALAMRRPDLHQMEGTLVYLGGLALVYALARRHHEMARTAGPSLGWLKVPIAAYLAITLVLPILHGAARRADFVAHTLWVLGGCALIVAIALAISGAVDVALHLTRKDPP